MFLIPALLLGLVIPRAGAAARSESNVPTIKELGHEFEIQRARAGVERLAALERVEESLASLLQHGVDPDERAAARLLAGAVADERGNATRAAEAYRQALELTKNGSLAADADFGRIQALASSGHDAEVAGEWRRWLKRHSDSPLVPEAQLALAWNALRRGATAEAARAVAAMLETAPYRANDPRVALARATIACLDGQPAAALDRLGARPQDAAGLYLRAVCLARTGRTLPSAAAFQETAERFPDSPLRDHALLAKANTFLAAGDHRSAAEEFARVVVRARDPGVIAEAELREAGALFLSGRRDSALASFRDIAERHADTDVAARAQFLLGEALVAEGKPAEAIVEYNRVLTRYFQHAVAASAQYRVARCLDRLGRPADATSAYAAVVSGYPLQPEAPAAAYLAGVGLLEQGRPLAAAPYFQILLDRYAPRGEGTQPLVFASPERQELVEAALCLLELSYHRAGDLGQLSGAPHLLLQRMPPGRSLWRAWAELIDADAMAAQARYAEAQASLERILRDHADQPVATSAAKLLAWTCARQGRDSLAIATEERLLARAGSDPTNSIVSGALLDIAHVRFNEKRYREAAAAYEDFLRRFPGHTRRLTALYQCGVCYLRLDRAGDAVDRWERIVRDSASAPAAERAWARMGDTYFQAGRYDDAKRCYQGLLEHFAGSSGAALASLRLGQCDYNAGRDAEAVQAFAATLERYAASPMAREARRGTELALYRLSQRPDGEKVLAQLVEQFPASSFTADAQLQIAKRAYGEKRWAEAAEGFRRVVSGFPGYSAADQAQFLMADAWSQAGNADEARQAYEQFLSYFPGSELAITVQFRLGLADFASQDYLRAAVAFTRVLAESASAEMLSASRYNLALCERQLGRAEDARAELERYRRAWPNDARAADVAFQLGDLHEAGGRADSALAEFEIALASGPRPALATEAAYRVGLARERLGQAEAALRAYRQAASTGAAGDPFRLSAVARSAALHEKRHEFKLALAEYRDIVAHAQDRELVAAATEKVSQLAAGSRR